MALVDANVSQEKVAVQEAVRIPKRIHPTVVHVEKPVQWDKVAAMVNVQMSEAMTQPIVGHVEALAVEAKLVVVAFVLFWLPVAATVESVVSNAQVAKRAVVASVSTYKTMPKTADAVAPSALQILFVSWVSAVN